MCRYCLLRFILFIKTCFLFQIGQVIESPADFYHSRIPQKQRKKTLVDELLADAEFKNKCKKKYKTIVQEQTFKSKRVQKHMKNVNRDQKFKKRVAGRTDKYE